MTSSVQSLHIIFYIFSSFVVGWATDRFGPKWPLIGCALCLGFGYALSAGVQSLIALYVFYSLASFGAGIVWSLPLSMVQRWFVKRRGLALGITISGIGIGTFIWAPVIDTLIYDYGWRTAYLVMGIASALMLLPASLIVTTPEKKGLKPNGFQTLHSEVPGGRQNSPSVRRPMELSQAVRTKQLWLICLIQLMFNIGLFLVFVHSVPSDIQNNILQPAA